MSVKYIIFLLSLSLSHVLGIYTGIRSESWLEGKVQELENAVQRAGCQEYVARGYNYEHMFPLDDIAFDNVVVKKENEDLNYFEMHLAIKTAKDGIIILSPKAYPGANDLVFEFAVGIDFGVVTVLRLKKEGWIGRDEVARVVTPPLIFPNKYTKFYIIIENDVLTFGKEGESPIITYHDARLRSVKYFDMSSYGAYSAKFLYDCPVHA